MVSKVVEKLSVFASEWKGKEEPQVSAKSSVFKGATVELLPERVQTLHRNDQSSVEQTGSNVMLYMC